MAGPHHAGRSVAAHLPEPADIAPADAIGRYPARTSRRTRGDSLDSEEKAVSAIHPSDVTRIIRRHTHCDDHQVKAYFQVVITDWHRDLTDDVRDQRWTVQTARRRGAPGRSREARRRRGD